MLRTSTREAGLFRQPSSSPILNCGVRIFVLLSLRCSCACGECPGGLFSESDLKGISQR